jgi:hypothetical protein
MSSQLHKIILKMLFNCTMLSGIAYFYQTAVSNDFSHLSNYEDYISFVGHLKIHSFLFSSTKVSGSYFLDDPHIFNPYLTCMMYY